MRVLVIVPARGGSKGIPRKNLRLLGGVPLIGHALEACRAAERIHRTVVSTEDEEIAVIAERWSTPVIPRRPELAGDEVPLAAVVYDVVQQLESQGEEFDVVATVQPTSPLIRASTLDRGLALFEDPEVDTVLSVYDNTHLSWTLDAALTPVPLFTERVNRQFLPRTYTESGGLIASRREVITPDERLGAHPRLVVLDPEEAVDIDTYADWWLAEKLLGRRRIVFHVVGSRETGLGHVYRALTLARRLTDHEVCFVTAQREDLAQALIKRHHFELTTYRDDPLTALDACHPDIVVNDVLDTDVAFVSALKTRGWRVVNFEDLGPGVPHADAVINALYEMPIDHDHDHDHDHVYSGSDYYCLREEFYSVRRRPVRATVTQLLVCFGGTDPAGLTLKTVRALGGLPPGPEITVIIGAGYADEPALSAALDTLDHDTRVVSDTNVISRYMEQADLMITSAGRTSYEAAVVGVPTLVLCQNERELRHLFATADHGFVNLGLGNDVSDDTLVAELRGLLADPDRRRDLQYRLWRWDGTRGIDRVLDIIVGTDRHQ